MTNCQIDMPWFRLSMEGDVLQVRTSGQNTRLSVIGNTHKEYLPNINCSAVDLQHPERSSADIHRTWLTRGRYRVTKYFNMRGWRGTRFLAAAQRVVQQQMCPLKEAIVYEMLGGKTNSLDIIVKGNIIFRTCDNFLAIPTHNFPTQQ